MGRQAGRPETWGSEYLATPSGRAAAVLPRERQSSAIGAQLGRVDQLQLRLEISENEGELLGKALS